MLKEEFEYFWNTNFKETIPLYFTFREAFPERWLRIHSLPESKRYADSESEMKILLCRQNQVFSDEIKENDDIYLVRDEYFINTGEIEDEFDFYPEYNFQKISVIKLNDYYNDYEENEKLNILVTKDKWKKNHFNKLLEDIANDVSMVFFISIKRKIIFAPYDGGMDIIYQNEQQRNFYKEIYKNWLSKRDDGL